jgi:hypothetical protein
MRRSNTLHAPSFLGRRVLHETRIRPAFSDVVGRDSFAERKVAYLTAGLITTEYLADSTQPNFSHKGLR